MKYIIKKTVDFDHWLKKLRDRRALHAILVRILRSENGNFGDIKLIGNSIYEMRIFIGKGYRVYFSIKNQNIIILLIGGHKGTQQKDIEKAYQILSHYSGDL